MYKRQALTSLRGGDPQQIGHAAAMALKNLMGLVCDPVAGLVEDVYKRQAPDSSDSRRPAPPLRHARRPARWVLRCEGHTGPVTDTPVSVWLGPSRSREGSGILLTALVQRQREWHLSLIHIY